MVDLGPWKTGRTTGSDYLWPLFETVVAAGVLVGTVGVSYTALGLGKPGTGTQGPTVHLPAASAHKESAVSRYISQSEEVMRALGGPVYPSVGDRAAASRVFWKRIRPVPASKADGPFEVGF